MTTGATLFSGGELAGVGMRNAGIEHRWGIEIDADIAGVAQANGFNSIVADVLTVDPAQMEPVDCLHASPVCTRASTANQGAELNEDGTKEAPLDIAMGEKVAQFIDVLRPRIVTIENVYAYRNFRAFKVICAALDRGGYFWDYQNLNSADFGVPQTRRRLILRAVRGALLPMLPQAEPWIGWYQAIEDLIPGLPESKFAPWQLERLPAELAGSLLVGAGNTNIPEAQTAQRFNLAVEPAPSVAAQAAVTRMRAFILSNAKTEYGDGIRYEAEPVHTVTGESNGRTRAFVVDSQDAGAPGKHGERGLTVRQEDEPMFTVSASMWPRRPARAWLVTGQNSKGNGFPVVADNEPSFTVTNQAKGYARAWFQHGRVVSMTPRALARFQSVPNSYVLPEKNGLACKVIGNGVPSLLMQRIYEGLLR